MKNSWKCAAKLKIMLLEFLKTKRTKEELNLVLDILKEFKGHESQEEWAFCSFESWVKLEQFEDYLRLLTEREIEEVDDDRAKEHLSALQRAFTGWYKKEKND